MKSMSFTPLPINAALKAAGEFLKSDLQWKAVNEIQSRYLTEFFEDDTEDLEFVKRKASTSIEDINAFLSKNGFPGVHLDPLGTGEFAIAGVMDQKVVWEVCGRSSKLTGRDKNEYNAVEFSNGGWSVFKYRNHKFPVAVISSKSSDNVYLTFPQKESENKISDLFDIMKLAEEITKKKGRLQKYDHLIIPKITYEGDIDVKWIIDMNTIDRKEFPWIIRDALMKSRLRLNHLGARAQAALKATIFFGGPVRKERYFIFNRPFLIWFTHKEKVTFVAYINEEHWKDPGDNIFY